MEHTSAAFTNDDAYSKNTTGKLGAICNYCGGYGFTNSLKGGSIGCIRCMQTGIEPVDTRKLAEQVEKLTELVKQLVNKRI